MSGPPLPLPAQEGRSDLRRWRQSVRREVRNVVKESGVAPALTLWASEGGSPRRVARFPVGAARDAAEVAFNVRQGIVVSRSRFAAVGRRLHVAVEDVIEEDGSTSEPVETAVFGLVIAGEAVAPGTELALESWEVTVVNGELGPWREGEFEAGQLFALMAAGLRDVERMAAP
jgi:hypothetical protein